MEENSYCGVEATGITIWNVLSLATIPARVLAKQDAGAGIAGDGEIKFKFWKRGARGRLSVENVCPAQDRYAHSRQTDNTSVSWLGARSVMNNFYDGISAAMRLFFPQAS